MEHSPEPFGNTVPKSFLAAQLHLLLDNPKVAPALRLGLVDRIVEEAPQETQERAQFHDFYTALCKHWHAFGEAVEKYGLKPLDGTIVDMASLKYFPENHSPFNHLVYFLRLRKPNPAERERIAEILEPAVPQDVPLIELILATPLPEKMDFETEVVPYLDALKVGLRRTLVDYFPYQSAYGTITIDMPLSLEVITPEEATAFATDFYLKAMEAHQSLMAARSNHKYKTTPRVYNWAHIQDRCCSELHRTI